MSAEPTDRRPDPDGLDRLLAMAAEPFGDDEEDTDDEVAGLRLPHSYGPGTTPPAAGGAPAAEPDPDAVSAAPPARAHDVPDAPAPGRAPEVAEAGSDLRGPGSGSDPAPRPEVTPDAQARPDRPPVRWGPRPHPPPVLAPPPPAPDHPVDRSISEPGDGTVQEPLGPPRPATSRPPRPAAPAPRDEVPARPSHPRVRRWFGRARGEGDGG